MPHCPSGYCLDCTILSLLIVRERERIHALRSIISRYAIPMDVHPFSRNEQRDLTVNRQHGRFADPPGSDVLSHARIIPLMPELGPPQHQVSISGLNEVVGRCHVVRDAVRHGGGLGRASNSLERRAILQPVDLRLRHSQWRCATEFRVSASLHGQRVRR